MFVYACFCMRMQAQCMCTHTTGLCMQAYVCVCKLLPRNPNFDFPVSFAMFFFLPNMPLF